MVSVVSRAPISPFQNNCHFTGYLWGYYAARAQPFSSYITTNLITHRKLDRVIKLIFHSGKMSLYTAAALNTGNIHKWPLENSQLRGKEYRNFHMKRAKPRAFAHYHVTPAIFNAPPSAPRVAARALTTFFLSLYLASAERGDKSHRSALRAPLMCIVLFLFRP